VIWEALPWAFFIAFMLRFYVTASPELKKKINKIVRMPE